MAIVISGVNNNDKITASDGLIDILSGVSFASTITAPGFSATNNLTAASINVGSNIQIGNAGIITATTLIGNVTGNVNHTSNLLLQISGSEKLRIANSGAFGLNGTNYGSSGQVLTSQGSGSSPTWTTISSDLVSDTSPQLGGTLDTNNQDITFNGAQNVSWDSSAADFIFNDYAKINLGTDKDFRMYQDTNNTILQSSNTAGGVYLQGALVQIGSETGEAGVKFVKDGAVEIYHDNQKRLYTDSDGVTIGQTAYAQLKIDGQVGDCILSSSGAQIEFTRASASNILCSNSAGYLNFFTSGQTTYPAMRIFTTPSVESGAKVGINTDTIGVDAQMYIASRPGQPGLYSSYGMRLNPNGDSNNRISKATGVYALSKGITADNSWHTVAIGRYNAATVTIRVGDSSSKRSMFINYDLTAPNYGVAHYNIIANNGNWNTGSADFQISSSGSYDYALQIKHSSYYNSSNSSGVYMIFNVC